MDKNNKNIRFVTGSQHLYGDEALRQVASNSKEIVEFLNEKLRAGVSLIWKGTVKTADEITEAVKDANSDSGCIGVITWMHTFSPSKMWITGLNSINKPILHLHTQFNEKLPFDTIDMDFMNLNQAAHGDKEHGFIYARMRKRRKVVVGYWKDEDTVSQINTWVSACVGFNESNNLKICRFGDNMRDVAVTEGDKVSAEIKLGWSVNGYGVGDLVKYVNNVTDDEANSLIAEYKSKYEIVTGNSDAVKEQAKYEAAIEKFMNERGIGAFTTTFEDLHGLKQLPGLACQRLMEKGYGFGGEGDWKTAAMARIMKVMANNEKTSFMEDYTYNFEKGNEFVLGAHMLEVCPTLADKPEKIKIDVRPLGIGGKEPPARMVFDGAAGSGIYVTLIDLGNRFRILLEEIEGMAAPRKMPNLPVASVMWKLKPNFHDANKAWIIAGGAHHSVISYSLTKEHIIDFARMAGIECVVIGDGLDISSFETDLMIGDLIWG
jgi:L-arabinose isomerase